MGVTSVEAGDWVARAGDGLLRHAGGIGDWHLVDLRGGGGLSHGLLNGLSGGSTHLKSVVVDFFCCFFGCC